MRRLPILSSSASDFHARRRIPAKVGNTSIGAGSSQRMWGQVSSAIHADSYILNIRDIKRPFIPMHYIPNMR